MIPKLLDPVGLSGIESKNLRQVILPRLGEVTRVLTEQTANLLPPDTLDESSLNEWRDAIAEEILLLAQVDRARAQRIAGPLERSKPFRDGPELKDLIGLEAAAVVIPVDTRESRQGAWLHLWVVEDPAKVIARDDRERLEGVESWVDGKEYRLFLVPEIGAPPIFRGRSWQLGASLARRALFTPFKLDLATQWIVTGEVRDGQVLPVGIGNKINLPWKNRGRHWLIPAANSDALSEEEAGRLTVFKREAAGQFSETSTVDFAWSRVTHEEEQTVHWTEGSPFPGLVPYDVRLVVAPGLEVDYSKVFFGRKEAVRKCRRLLQSAAEHDCAFLLVVGDSGSGKSSLARAGLASELVRPGVVPGIGSWRTVIFRPGETPIASLAYAVQAGIPELAKLFDATQFETAVFADPEQAAHSLAGSIDPGTGVLFVVDQLEDVLLGNQAESPGVSGSAGGPDEKKQFFLFLNELARSGLTWVIATLRAGQFDSLIRDETLRKLKEDGASYDMAPPDFEEIIRAPVRAAGLDFQRRADGSDLADLLLKDLKSQGGSDALPLLQMTLKQLFESRDSKFLTFAAYQQIGGLEGAIGHHADQVLAELEEAVRRELTPLLIGLTRREPDGAYLSRPMAQTNFETTAERRLLVRTISDARLIVVGQDGEIRVAHEALLRRWKAASEILLKHDLLLRVREELGPWVKVWLHSPDYLLPDGLLLAQAQSNLDHLKQLLGSSDPVIRFVEASVEKSLSQRNVIRERSARDRQKIAGLLEQSKFGEAANELDRVADYLHRETHPEIAKLTTDIDQQRQRIRRIAEFLAAAEEAETLGGEEDFWGAYRRSEDALRALGQELDLSVAAQDLKPAQVTDLKGAIYRVRLLFSALQLAPGIVDLFRRMPRAKRLPIDLSKVLGWVPGFVWGAIFRSGGLGPLRLPGRQDNPAALAEFRKCLETLTDVEGLEKARAADAGEHWQPSRTSILLDQLARVLSELADGPAGERIDYAKWLLGVRSADRPEPVNAADYFFIGLFNYFIGKRKEDWLGKVLSALQGRFPDLDGQTPLATAERLLRAATALEPEHFWPHWLLGRTLLEAREPGSAELAFNAAIAVRPNYARGYEQRALSLAHQWRVAKHPRLRQRALTDSSRAIRCAGGDPSIFWPRGELFEAFGEITAALDAYSRWMELEENILSLISRKAGLVKLEQLAEELSQRKPVENAPGLLADAHALSALVYLTQAGWHEDASTRVAEASEFSRKAWEAAAKALDRNSDHPHALTVQGVLQRQNGEYKTAIATLEQAFRIDTCAYRAGLNRALAYEQAGEPGFALAAWRDLEVRSSASGATDRELCPPWILQRAEAARGRLGAEILAPQEKPAGSTGMAVTSYL